MTLLSMFCVIMTLAPSLGQALSILIKTYLSAELVAWLVPCAAVLNVQEFATKVMTVNLRKPHLQLTVIVGKSVNVKHLNLDIRLHALICCPA